MHALPQALQALASYRQFIVFKLVPSATRPGKSDKLPCDFRSGRVASAHDQTIWTDAATAMAAAAHYGAEFGTGFVFTREAGFWFLDVDGCYTPEAGWSPLAQSLVQALDGAAIEVSSSGKGLHFFGRGAVPEHGCTNKAYGLEFYTEGRFVALTGINTRGDAGADMSHLMPSLVAQFFPPSSGAAGSSEWTTGPCAGWNGPLDDDELLRRALRSGSAKAAFGSGATFADLWTGNVDALVKAYPDAGGSHPYDQSAADLALAQHLAFWTGKDCERIKSLMLRSALVRAKWDRDDYLDHFTIPKAVSRQGDVLQDKAVEPIAGAPAREGEEHVAPKAAAVTGATWLTVEQAVDLLNGAVYVCDMHKILVPGGVMLKEGQFKVMFGGYNFPMDNSNDRMSRDAWEAFTQNQAFRSPRADSFCFRPDLPAGTITNQGGRTLANTYWPIETPRAQGDIGPFSRHLAKLIPDDRDRQIVLSYMAAVVQHKGVKFQWAPFFQGTEGNGKTLLTRCVAFAVGDRYSYFPKASDIADKFNDWMYGSIFIGVEDVYVSHDRGDVMEELKPMITSERQQIQGKGEKKETRNVCCNFMLNSNRKDGLVINKDGRRFSPFFTAQQSKGDIERDGMGGQYFPDLYKWLRGGGYAIVSELLHTYPIPDEFNPATECQTAPRTSSEAEAIAVSQGGVEQEIQESVAQEIPGFCGGWLSSMALNTLLERVGAARRIPHNKRRELLSRLGYMPHPGLVGGRVNNTIMPDCGKPTLYITVGHPHSGLQGPAIIADAYTAANTPVKEYAR